MEVSFQHSSILTYFLCSSMGYWWTAAPQGCLRSCVGPSTGPSPSGVSLLWATVPSEAYLIQHRLPSSKSMSPACPQQCPLPHASPWTFFCVPSCLSFGIPSRASSHEPSPRYLLPQGLSPLLKHVWAAAPCAPLTGWSFGMWWVVFIQVRASCDRTQGSSWPPPTLGALQPPATHDPIQT